MLFVSWLADSLLSNFFFFFPQSQEYQEPWSWHPPWNVHDFQIPCPTSLEIRESQMFLPSPAIPLPGLKGNKQAPASTANPGAFEIGSLHFLNLPQSSFVKISKATFFRLLFCGELSSYLLLQLGMKTELLIFKVIYNVNFFSCLWFGKCQNSVFGKTDKKIQVWTRGN